jgi:hypothetical protein
MTTLNGVQILEAIGNVDDGLVAESLDFFCGEAAGGVPVFAPAPKRKSRVLRTVLAWGLAAAMLCGGVTVLPLLGGPDLWGGIYGVIAPLLKPDETEIPEESEYECEADPEEATEEPEDEEDDEDETRKNSNFFNPDEYFTGGVIQQPATVPTPNVPTAPDPRPEWPTISWDPPRPQTPTVPYPNVPTPGPTPWP